MTRGITLLLTIASCAARADAPCGLLDAVQAGNGSLVKTLLSKGATLEYTNADGQTVLAVSAVRGDQDIGRRLLDHHADPEKKDHNGATALINAATAGRTSNFCCVEERVSMPRTERV